jgi:hypothetical protein
LILVSNSLSVDGRWTVGVRDTTDVNYGSLRTDTIKVRARSDRSDGSVEEDTSDRDSDTRIRNGKLIRSDRPAVLNDLQSDFVFTMEESTSPTTETTIGTVAGADIGTYRQHYCTHHCYVLVPPTLLTRLLVPKRKQPEQQPDQQHEDQ